MRGILRSECSHIKLKYCKLGKSIYLFFCEETALHQITKKEVSWKIMTILLSNAEFSVAQMHSKREHVCIVLPNPSYVENTKPDPASRELVFKDIVENLN